MPYTAMRNLAAGDLVTESDMDALRQNIDYLHLPNVAYASGTYQTIAGTAFQNIVGCSAIFTAYNGLAVMVMMGGFSAAPNALGWLAISVDGTRVISSMVYHSASIENITLHYASALASGSHTIIGQASMATAGTTGSITAPKMVVYGG